MTSDAGTTTTTANVTRNPFTGEFEDDLCIFRYNLVPEINMRPVQSSSHSNIVQVQSGMNTFSCGNHLNSKNHAYEVQTKGRGKSGKSAGTKEGNCSDCLKINKAKENLKAQLDMLERGMNTHSCESNININDPSQIAKSPEKKFICIQCNKSLSRKDALLRHFRKCHREDYESLRYRLNLIFTTSNKQTVNRKAPKQPKINQQKSKFVCISCGTGLSRRDSLIRHRKKCKVLLQTTPSEPSSANNFQDESLSCQSCRINFYSKSAYEHHLVGIHSIIDQKRFVCSKCGKSLSRKDALLRHMRKCNIVLPPIEQS